MNDSVQLYHIKKRILCCCCCCRRCCNFGTVLSRYYFPVERYVPWYSKEKREGTWHRTDVPKYFWVRYGQSMSHSINDYFRLLFLRAVYQNKAEIMGQLYARFVFFCEKSFQQKKLTSKKSPRVLRTNNSFLRKLLMPLWPTLLYISASTPSIKNRK